MIKRPVKMKLHVYLYMQQYNINVSTSHECEGVYAIKENIDVYQNTTQWFSARTRLRHKIISWNEAYSVCLQQGGQMITLSSISAFTSLLRYSLDNGIKKTYIGAKIKLVS